MIFDNRETAGRLLGEWLKEKLGKEGNYIVLGIPRGGVVVAKKTAEILGVPLGVLIVRKLGVPENPELAFGALDPDGNIYLDKSTVEYFGLTPQIIQKVAQEELKKIREREKKFERGLIKDFKDKDVIVVDDGVATGMTVEAGVEYLKRKGAKKGNSGSARMPQRDGREVKKIRKRGLLLLLHEHLSLCGGYVLQGL